MDRDDVLELSLVGNPIMHHLALGLDPSELGMLPSPLPPLRRSIHRPELGLRAHGGARVYSLPCIAGHVGADGGSGVVGGPTPCRASAIARRCWDQCRAGPGEQRPAARCFEPDRAGVRGCRSPLERLAAPGNRTSQGRTFDSRGPASPSSDRTWSDEPGFDFGAVTGICGSGIIEVIAELHLAGVIDTDGVIRPPLEPSSRVVASDRTFSYVLCSEPLIEVTQNDVRAVQLAKAALHAGARLLMDHYGVEGSTRSGWPGLSAVISIPCAMVLGMIPDCDIERVSAARECRRGRGDDGPLSAVARTEIEQVARVIEKVETAVEPRFQEHFVAALAIPTRLIPTAPVQGRGSPPRPEPGERRRRRPQ